MGNHRPYRDLLLQAWVGIDKPRVLHSDSDQPAATYIHQQWSLSVVSAETVTCYADQLIQWLEKNRPRSTPK